MFLNAVFLAPADSHPQPECTFHHSLEATLKLASEEIDLLVTISLRYKGVLFNCLVSLWEALSLTLLVKSVLVDGTAMRPDTVVLLGELL